MLAPCRNSLVVYSWSWSGSGQGCGCSCDHSDVCHHMQSSYVQEEGGDWKMRRYVQEEQVSRPGVLDADQLCRREEDTHSTYRAHRSVSDSFLRIITVWISIEKCEHTFHARHVSSKALARCFSSTLSLLLMLYEHEVTKL